jgi:REP element-mobilizing transposase RayT
MTLNERPTPKGPVMHSDDRRCWLLTWTTYGTWLPGDERGFVSSVPQPEGPQRRHNIVGTPYDRHKPSLVRASQKQQKHESVLLTHALAMALLDQFHETADHRCWRIHAVAIMRNHVHLVVGVAGDPPPDTLLRDFKSYASRALNDRFGRHERWWTESGSKRKLPDEPSLIAGVRYVRDQQRPLVIWLNPDSPATATSESAG